MEIVEETVSLSDRLLQVLFKDDNLLTNMQAEYKVMLANPALHDEYGKVCISLEVNLGNLTPHLTNYAVVLLPIAFMRGARFNNLIEMYDTVKSANIDDKYDIAHVITQTRDNVSSVALHHLARFVKAVGVAGKLPSVEEYAPRPVTSSPAETAVFDAMRWVAPFRGNPGYGGFIIPLVRDLDGPASPYIEFWNTAHYLSALPTDQIVFMRALPKYIALAAKVTPLREQWRLFNYPEDYADGSPKYAKIVALMKVKPNYSRSMRLNNVHLVDEDYKTARRYLGADEAAKLAAELKVANLPPGVEDSDDEDDLREPSEKATRNAGKGKRKQTKVELEDDLD
jgi:hypothetical protein